MEIIGILIIILLVYIAFQLKIIKENLDELVVQGRKKGL